MGVDPHGADPESLIARALMSDPPTREKIGVGAVFGGK
jgi:hypothetical protein